MVDYASLFVSRIGVDLLLAGFVAIGANPERYASWHGHGPNRGSYSWIWAPYRRRRGISWSWGRPGSEWWIWRRPWRAGIERQSERTCSTWGEFFAQI